MKLTKTHIGDTLACSYGHTLNSDDFI